MVRAPTTAYIQTCVIVVTDSGNGAFSDSDDFCDNI